MDSTNLKNSAAIAATAAMSPAAALQLLQAQEVLSGIDTSKLSFARNDSLNEVYKEDKIIDTAVNEAKSKDSKNISTKNRVGRPSKSDTISNEGLKHLIVENTKSNARNTSAIINSSYDLKIAEINAENKEKAKKKKPVKIPSQSSSINNKTTSVSNNNNDYSGENKLPKEKQEKTKSIIEKIFLNDGGQGSNKTFSIGDYVKAKSKIHGSDMTVGFYHDEVIRLLSKSVEDGEKQFNSLSKTENYNKKTSEVISSKKFLDPNMRKDERASSIYNNESDVGRFFNREASVGRKLKEGAAFNRAMVENEKTTIGKIMQVFENPRFKASFSDNFISLFSKGKTLEEKDKSLTYKEGEKSEIALTTVIPGLLSKILSAVSKSEETFYDWRTGSFKTAKTLTDESIDASRKEVAEIRKMEEKSKGLFGLNLKFLGADAEKTKDLIKRRIEIESNINSGGFGLSDNKGLEAFASENFKKGGSAGSEISKVTEMFKMQKTFPNLSMIEIENVTKNIPSSKERNKKLIEYSIKRYKEENPEDSPAELAQAIRTLNKKDFTNVEIVVSENLKDAEENYELYAKLLKQADSLQALEKIRIDILSQVNFLSGFAYSRNPKAKAIKDKFKKLLKDIEDKRARIFQGEDFTLSKAQKASFAKENTSLYDSSAFPEKDVGVINEKFKTLKDNITFNFDEIIAAQRELISLTTIKNVIKETKDSISELFEKDIKREKKNFESKGFSQNSNMNSNAAQSNNEEHTKDNKFSTKWETLETRNKRELAEKRDKLSVDAYKVLIKLPKILENEVEKPISKGINKVAELEEEALDYTKRKDIRSILWNGLKSVGSAIAGVASTLLSGLTGIIGRIGGIVAGGLAALGLGLSNIFGALGGKKLLDLLPDGMKFGKSGGFDASGNPIDKKTKGKNTGKMHMPGGAYDDNGKPIKKQSLRTKLDNKIGMKSIIGMGVAGAAVNYAADEYMEDGLGKDLAKTGGTALEYAAMGATVGSIIPGLGTAVGAAIGAGVGAVVANWDKITQATGFTFFGKDAQYDENGNILEVRQKPVISRMTDFMFGADAEADENGNITSLAQKSILGKFRDSIFGSGSVTTEDGQLVQAGQTGLLQVMAGGLSSSLKFLFGSEEEPGIFTKAGQWFGLKIDEIGNGITSVKNYVFGSEESPGLFQQAGQWFTDGITSFTDGITGVKNYIFGTEEAPGVFTRAGSWFEDRIVDFTTSLGNIKDYIFGTEESPGVFQRASNWFSSNIDSFGEMLVNLPNLLVDGFKTVSDKIVELPDTISTFLKETFDSMKTKFDIFAEELPNIPGRMFDWFSEKLSALPNWIKSKLGLGSDDEEAAKDLPPMINQWSEKVKTTEFQLQNKNINGEERSKLEQKLLEYQKLEATERAKIEATGRVLDSKTNTFVAKPKEESEGLYSKTLKSLDNTASQKTTTTVGQSDVKIKTNDELSDKKPSMLSKVFGSSPTVKKVGEVNTNNIKDVFNTNVEASKISSLDPTLLHNLKNLGVEFQEKFGRKLTINSAYRSPEYQEKLFKDAVAKYGSEEKARKWVALPGSSMHNYGFAVDIQSKDANDAAAAGLLEKYGLARPVKHEDWHVELAGIDRAGIRTAGMSMLKNKNISFSASDEEPYETEGVQQPSSDFSSKTSPNSTYVKTQIPGSTSGATTNNKNFEAKSIQSPEQVATSISGDTSLLTSYAFSSMKIQEMMLVELKSLNSKNGTTTVQPSTQDYNASNSSNSSSSKTVGVSNITVNKPTVVAQKQPVAQPQRTGDYNFSQKSISEAAS